MPPSVARERRNQTDRRNNADDSQGDGLTAGAVAAGDETRKVLAVVGQKVIDRTGQRFLEPCDRTRLVVEGLDEKGLRATATRLGRTPPADLKSLKLIEECLVASGLDTSEAKETAAPFHRVHNLRSKVKGHASGDEASSIKKNVLMEFGSYVQHFQVLCAECDSSIRRLIDLLGAGT